MTTIHRPAQSVPLNHGTQNRVGNMLELAARHAVPRVLRPLRVSGPFDGPAAPPVRGGVVPRCALFGRLAEAERVVQVSAPAGSGKTGLMRSWIASTGGHERCEPG